MSAPRILIMAGGTGGHIFPALAVARELQARGAEVSWLGTRRGLEARVVPEAGIAIDYISVAGLRGNGLLGWALAPLRLARALWQALAVMRRRRPQAVLGLGGFVTGPGGIAARLSGRPLLIHEQNAVPGLTNRLLAPLAKRVMQGFPESFKGKGETVGNPVRAEIAALAAPAERFAGRSGPLRLLVVGGSLGAVAINEAVPQAVAQLAEAQRPQIRHQSGERNIEAARRSYRDNGVEAELVPFIEDMASAYAWADLVLCRAGALTISELAAAGLPALLVPYPHAVDDHQSANAAYLTGAGAAILLPQVELTAQRLSGVLAEFADDAASGRQRLLAMAEMARGCAQTESTSAVARACLAAAGADTNEGVTR